MTTNKTQKSSGVSTDGKPAHVGAKVPADWKRRLEVEAHERTEPSEVTSGRVTVSDLVREALAESFDFQLEEDL